MRERTAPQSSGKTALRSGLIMGIALGVIHSAISIILTQMTAPQQNSAVTYNSLTTVLYLLTPLIWIVGLLVVGTVGSHATGKVNTGLMAGLFAGTFGGILAGFGQVIATALATNQTNSADSSGVLLFAGFAAIFYVLALAIGAGAGLGALGGLIGQSISNVRPQPPVQQVYASPLPPVAYAYAAPQPVPFPQPVATPPQQAAVPPLPEQ